MANTEKILDLNRLRGILSSSNLYSYEGRISQIVGMTIEATGIECNIGDVCDIQLDSGGEKILAEAVGFREDKVLLMPYQDIEGVGYGSTVRNLGRKLSIQVGPGLMGRTVDAMGLPMDGGPPIQGVAEYPINGTPSTASSPSARASVWASSPAAAWARAPSWA